MGIAVASARPCSLCCLTGNWRIDRNPVHNCPFEKYALHPRANPAYVKAAHLRFTQVETVSQAHIVNTLRCKAAVFERVNISAFNRQPENEIAERLPIFIRVNAGFDIFDVSAETGKILTYTCALSAGWTNAVIAVIIKQCVTNGRREPLAQRIAQETPCHDWVARCRQRTRTIWVGEERVFIERDIVLA